MKASNNIGHGAFSRLFGFLLLVDLLSTLIILQFGAGGSLILLKYLVEGIALFIYLRLSDVAVIHPTDWKKLNKKMDYHCFLERVSQILVSDFNFQVVFGKFLKELEREITMDYALIFRVEEKGRKFAPYMYADRKGAICSLNQHFELMKEEFWHQALRSDQTTLLSDPAQIETIPYLAKQGVQSLVIVPMLYKNRVHGFLLLGSQEVEHYQTTNLNLLNAVAERLVISIENCVLYQQTKELSLKDYLTGCPNRRALDLQLDYEYRRAKRYQESFSILALDIDHFKQLNDCYGHLVGDKILQELAQIMRDEVREIDMVSRFGGEEFVILLPGTNEDQAAIVAERIRQRVDEQIFLPEGEQIQMTVSIGVASFADDMEGIQELLKGADLKLYSAKECGRNQVVHLGAHQETAATVDSYLQ